ncbi:adenosine 5'-monophosphoramidase HINT3-like isoform X1 [Homalodisca vitripennis]|uniref:adenosine 5'-monophosphoramidase HINT3-like isoform X1 n=1 Tax=Homalodisca vitripennis TaxID=197043 RepID=UPI001EEBD907|nr:adenosine 5'-monophosphoramidase HINT3-like isoform X1 [Homalodisca vitripennis]
MCKLFGAKKSDIGSKRVNMADDELVVFPDIKPAAPHHYLVVPKSHLLNAKQLGPEHKPLVENMIETAKRILEEKGCDLANASLGFHWPPFNMISHLHLHAIAPQSEMGFAAKLMFRPDSWWFVTPQYVLSRL